MKVVNERLRKSHIAERIRKLESGDNIDWASAEALAIGSLLHQGELDIIVAIKCLNLTIK